MTNRSTLRTSSDREKLSTLALELSRLLQLDYEDIFYYLRLLNGEELPFSESAEKDGLIIRGANERPVPLHPRMALSNIYRISAAKKPDIKKKRTKIDAIIGVLIPVFEQNFVKQDKK